MFAIGDMHGCYDSYCALLRAAGLVNSSCHWTGGRAFLVQTGDLVDRGPGSLANLRLTRRLQEEARQAGGEVRFLLGGHEVFALAAAQGNDWAFLNWFSAQNGGSATLLEWLAEDDFPASPSDEQLAMMYGAFLNQFDSGEFGAWLMGSPTCTRVDGTVFVHAGISREVPQECDSLNDQASMSLLDLRQYLIGSPDPVLGRRGPYWVRDIGRDEVDSVLLANDSRRIVCGHNPAPGVTALFDAKSVIIDTGVVRGGPPLAVRIMPDGLIVFDSRGNEQTVLYSLQADSSGAKRLSLAPASGRFGRGDVVEFYHSSLTGARAFLKVQDVWASGRESYYSGKQLASIPGRKQDAIRFNGNEAWIYHASFIERVGVPAAEAARSMPPELSRALKYIS
ncbi:MAG: metallophosphoesterase [Bacillota bacterium]|nr:metallophosphoesterase [Bacillota bacterium]